VAGWTSASASRHRGHNHRTSSQSRRSDERKRRFERARTLNWWRRARLSSRRSLRVDEADWTLAPVRKTSRIARRVPRGDRNVNIFARPRFWRDTGRFDRSDTISESSGPSRRPGAVPRRSVRRTDQLGSQTPPGSPAAGLGWLLHEFVCVSHPQRRSTVMRVADVASADVSLAERLGSTPGCPLASPRTHRAPRP
jgi:hypothetical protein